MTTTFRKCPKIFWFCVRQIISKTGIFKWTVLLSCIFPFNPIFPVLEIFFDVNQLKLSMFREDPVELGSFWYGLPGHIDHVDAVYEKQNHDIVFFVGKVFYILSGNSQLKYGPQPLTVTAIVMSQFSDYL